MNQGENPFDHPGRGDDAHPFGGSALHDRQGADTMVLDQDDEIVGLFARTPFAPGSGPRVDLMPAEIVSARRVQRFQRGGLLALVGVVLVVLAAYALVVAERSVAREDLAGAQAETARLTAEQARYARAPLVYAEVDAIEAELATVMADDVSWYQYLADLSVSTPPGLWLTSWTATMTDPAAAAAVDPSVAAVTAPDGPDLATLTIGGSSQDERQVPDWLEVLDRTPGLRGAYASSLTRSAIDETPVLTFESSASMAQSARSDRYAETEK